MLGISHGAFFMVKRVDSLSGVRTPNVQAFSLSMRTYQVGESKPQWSLIQLLSDFSENLPGSSSVLFLLKYRVSRPRIAPITDQEKPAL